VTAPGPLRGPGKKQEGGGCAATDSQGAPRTLRGRPSGVKGAAHRCATACGRPGHRSLYGPWRQEEWAGQGLPRRMRGARDRYRRGWARNGLVFDNTSRTKNYKKPVRGSLHTFRGLPLAADGRLKSEPMIWLTTVTPSGQPQSTPVWFLWQDPI
jgi:hypothetical protein